MPNVIDTLLIELGLDASKFNKAQKESVEGLRKIKVENERNSKDIEYRAKSMAQAFGSVKNQILGLLGVSLTASGIKSFVEQLTTGDAAVGRLARNMGIATSELSAWEGVASKFGGNAQDMDAAFRNVNKIVQTIHQYGNAGSATGPLGLLFAHAGMNTGLAQLIEAGRNGDVEKAMRLIQQATAQAPDRGNAMMLLGQAGFSETTFNVLRDIGDQLDKNLQLQRDLNVVSQKDADIAQQRQAAVSKLGDAFTHLGRSMANSGLLDFAIQKTTAAVQYLASGELGSAVYDLIHGSSSGSKTSSPLMPRGIRNHNPGNLKFAGQKGAGKDAQGFATFGSDAAGMAALANQLQLYSARGVNTVASIISKYAPASDHNNTAAYIADVAGKLGVGANTPLHLQDVSQLRAMMIAMANHENGSQYHWAYAADAGLAMYTRKSQGAVQTDVRINTINVNTQATDAKGIARKINGAIQDSYSFASHANTAVQ
ncbi:MAG: hypothetical protein KGL35_02600 [Bradyrhizobium sp.]|nr:hypothetical protein [Bradyrhizobium sp.]